MSQRTTVRTLLSLAAACTALLAFASPGMAHNRGDRNHDRIPDRWERAHHLSLKVNQARRDQDHDGLRNRAEFLAGTNPRDADSDDDGRKDGAEDAGRIASFTAGVLVIRLFNGDEIKGTVDESTAIECERRDDGHGTARAASDGPGDDDGEHGDDDGEHRDGQHADGRLGDRDEDGEDDCDASALTTGAVVREAELKATSTGLVFREIELIS
ncbi:MAG TPA: hypothetical protein VF257_03805 [Solirubrobacteraceae bacterium]